MHLVDGSRDPACWLLHAWRMPLTEKRKLRNAPWRTQHRFAPFRDSCSQYRDGVLLRPSFDEKRRRMRSSGDAAFAGRTRLLVSHARQLSAPTDARGRPCPLSSPPGLPASDTRARRAHAFPSAAHRRTRAGGNSSKRGTTTSTGAALVGLSVAPLAAECTTRSASFLTARTTEPIPDPSRRRRRCRQLAESLVTGQPSAARAISAPHAARGEA